MRTVYDIYEEFGKCLIEDRIFEDPRVGYKEICSFLGVGEKDLDTVLFREIGEGGEELLKELRGQICY